MNDVPQIVEINEIIEETPTIKTFIFDWDMDKFWCSFSGGICNGLELP